MKSVQKNCGVSWFKKIEKRSIAIVTFLYKTKGNSSPGSKPRVYFTCHPLDFSICFERICFDQ